MNPDPTWWFVAAMLLAWRSVTDDGSLCEYLHPNPFLQGAAGWPDLSTLLSRCAMWYTQTRGCCRGRDVSALADEAIAGGVTKRAWEEVFITCSRSLPLAC